MDVTFRPFAPNTELAQQRDLFQDCFPETRGTPVQSVEHYRWKFHSIQTTPSSYEFSAWDSGGNILGYYAALPFHYFIHGERFVCGMVCDVMTHSRARGKGIFTKIGRYSLDQLDQRGVDFVSGYPIRPEVIPGHLKVGWHISRKLPLYMKVLSSSALLRKSALQRLAPILDLGLKILAIMTRSRRSLSANENIRTVTSVEFLSTQSQVYETFFSRWTAERTCYLEKNADFLRWRLSAPGAEYFITSLTNGAEIRAVVITRRTEIQGIPSLAILDLMALKEAEHSVGVVLNEITNLAHATGAEAIVVMSNHESARRFHFLWRGFIRTPFVFKLILKALSKRAVQLGHRLALSDVMWIDSDDL